MTRDELKAIIGGTVEALKLVADQAQFQSARNIECENGETVGVTFDIAIQLLDLVWDTLDLEVANDLDRQEYLEYLGKCWRNQ